MDVEGLQVFETCLINSNYHKLFQQISSFGDVSLCLKSSKEHLKLFCRLKYGIPARAVQTKRF